MQVRALQAQGPSLLGSHQVEIYLSMFKSSAGILVWVVVLAVVLLVVTEEKESTPTPPT